MPRSIGSKRESRRCTPAGVVDSESFESQPGNYLLAFRDQIQIAFQFQRAFLYHFHAGVDAHRDIHRALHRIVNTVD